MAQPFEIRWQAPEYEYHEKGVAWYWLSIIVAALIIAFSVWQKNFLFGLFVVIAEILFIVWGNRTPRLVGFILNESGIAIEEGTHYPFTEFESVGVDPFGNGWSELVFIYRAKLKTPLRVLFPENRLVEFRANMKTILKEVPYDPTVLDSIEKLVHF
jgi:hypothetical protein